MKEFYTLLILLIPFIGNATSNTNGDTEIQLSEVAELR